MRIIIHDLDDISFLNISNDDYVVNNTNNKNCIGCFNCWVKTPFHCIHKDKIHENGKRILESDELIIISKCFNGCYSSIVKRILERSISYVEPFFTIRNKMIHHKSRNNKKLKFSVYFYGDNITLEDKDIAYKLVNRNKENLNTKNANVFFYNDFKEIEI